MAIKIGRNDICPCGSGRKFKRCCMAKKESRDLKTRPPAHPVSLQQEIENIQGIAGEGKPAIRELGVFILFATAAGDAWLLEVTGGDAVLLASGRERLQVEVEENPETIAVNWSHRFAIVNKQLLMTAYSTREVVSCPDSPTHSIAAAIRRIKRKYSPTLLENVHIEEGQG